MFRPQAQAETHSRAQVAATSFTSINYEKIQLTSRNTQQTSWTTTCFSPSGTYFFLFLNRLQAQAHRDPGSSPRASRKDLFFLFINRLQAQAQARSGPGERHALFY
jgi:hypothetical protein